MSLLIAVLVGWFPALAPASVALAQNVDTAPAIEPATAWAKTAKETAIWSGWDAAAVEFAKIPKDITVQMIELRGNRAYVFFPGDGKGHKAGEVWIDRADLVLANVEAFAMRDDLGECLRNVPHRHNLAIQHQLRGLAGWRSDACGWPASIEGNCALWSPAAHYGSIP